MIKTGTQQCNLGTTRIAFYIPFGFLLMLLFFTCSKKTSGVDVSISQWLYIMESQSKTEYALKKTSQRRDVKVSATNRLRHSITTYHDANILKKSLKDVPDSIYIDHLLDEMYDTLSCNYTFKHESEKIYLLSNNDNKLRLLYTTALADTIEQEVSISRLYELGCERIVVNSYSTCINQDTIIESNNGNFRCFIMKEWIESSYVNENAFNRTTPYYDFTIFLDQNSLIPIKLIVELNQNFINSRNYNPELYPTPGYIYK